MKGIHPRAKARIAENSLPPFSSLRAFEAVSRHLSFRKAADELGLTPSAVSHQIRSLEEFLSIKLCRRSHRAIDLTPSGRRYAATIARGLSTLREGTREILAEPRQGELRVSAVPAFAAHFLIPRIDAFESAHRDVSLSVEVNSARQEFEVEDVDVGIRFGAGRWPGLAATRILTVRGIVVCLPALLAKAPRVKRPEDLAGKTWITISPQPEAWSQWCEAAGCPAIEPTRELRFDTLSSGLAAVEDGLGFLVAPDALVAEHLKSGRLCSPFEVEVQNHWAYYMVCRPAEKQLPKIRSFRRWIKSELAALPHRFDVS